MFSNRIKRYLFRCKRGIEIYIGNDVIVMKRDDTAGTVITYNGADVSIPSSHGGLIFEKISQYVIVRSTLGFQIRWDTYEMVFVTVTDDLRGKTKVSATALKF